MDRETKYSDGLNTCCFEEENWTHWDCGCSCGCNTCDVAVRCTVCGTLIHGRQENYILSVNKGLTERKVRKLTWKDITFGRENYLYRTNP